MGVFSKIKNFLYHHKNKFIISGGVIAATYLASRYAQYKLREWQEKETKEFLDRTRKQQHFESTERTCNQTIISLSTTLNETLNQLINTEEIVAQLRNNPSNRIELWDKLKILVFTRICALIYANTILIIILRIQLSIIGGYLFKDTKTVTSTMQQNYLSMNHLLLENGLQKITEIISEKVNDVVGKLDLKQKMSLQDVEQIFWTVQVRLCESELDPIKNIKEYVISDDLIQSKDMYSNMLKETADLLESEEVRSLATTSSNHCFSLLVDKLAEFYTSNGDLNTKETFHHPSKMQIPLAKLIPILNGLLSKNSIPDMITQKLINQDKLKTLGANIYEVFSYV